MKTAKAAKEAKTMIRTFEVQFWDDESVNSEKLLDLLAQHYNGRIATCEVKE